MVAASAFLAASGFSQNTDIKRPTFSVNFMLNDFKTAQNLRNSSLGDVFSDKKFSKVKDMDAGLSVNYLQGLTSHIDFMSTLGGSFTDYPNKDGVGNGDENFLLELDANVNIKLLTDKYFISPYLTAGVGGSMYKSKFGAYAPLGVGLQFNLGKEEAFIFTQAQYRVGITDKATNHLNFSLGFGAPLTEKKAVVLPPPPPPVDVDTDGDGIVDSKDKCVTVPGVLKYDGCPVPDTDGDGVNDDNDKCPTVAGLAKYNGCPIPDTDGDKINDEEDKCPTTPGLARYNGCPIPDRDNDGVNDEEDKCPDEAGPVSNGGCPKPVVPMQEIQEKMNIAAKKIYFQTGKSTLLAKSYPALNQVVDLLKTNNTLVLQVDGHTDNVGSDALNLKLSKARAASVVAYLAKKGITKVRINSEGYGESKPIATNKTAAGRQQNRRVELKISEQE